MHRLLIHRTAIFATLFACVVVMLGAWTRLVDAGLGCPDWPGCYGFLTVPETPEQIALAEARFPETPVETEKGWPEMIHRYFASTLGFIILCLSVYVFRAQRQVRHSISESSLPSYHVYGLLALVICQGLFGMWTVTLKLWPQVVSAHLLGGFATLSLLFLLILRTGSSTQRDTLIPTEPSKKIGRSAALFGLVLVVVQIFLGAWTASNYAALACGDELPTCQGSYWPEMDFRAGFNFMQELGPNYLGGTLDNESRVAIQVTHRIGALILAAYLVWMSLRIWRQSLSDLGLRVRQAVVIVLFILLVQLVLGLSNVILLIPLGIAVAHNAVGALLLLSMVNLNFQIHRLLK